MSESLDKYQQICLENQNIILHLENSIVLKKKEKISLPENRKFTWKICVYTTAWEKKPHFFWDFRRRQGGVSAYFCSAVLLGVPAGAQNWALDCPPHSSHLEQQGRRSAPSAQEWCNIPHPGHSEGCLQCLPAGDSTQPCRRGNSLQLPLLISMVLRSFLLRVPSQDTLGTRKALESCLQSILTPPWRDHFSRR